MVTENALQEHMAACEHTYKVMLDENRMLKAANSPPTDEFLDQKRAALSRLDGTLAKVRTLREAFTDLTPKHRAIIQKTQQIVLKALLLDRENEQMLLKSFAAPRAKIPQARPTLDQIQRLYKKHGIRPEVGG